MSTPLRLSCVWIYTFAALTAIITTVRPQQINNLQNAVEDTSGACIVSEDLKKIIGQNLIKESIKTPDVYYLPKEPTFIPPLYHISEPAYPYVPQSVYYYPEDYDSSRKHDDSPPTTAVPRLHYKSVQHILNDSAKSLKNIENMIWWNPGNSAKHLSSNAVVLSDLETTFRSLTCPPGDKQQSEESSPQKTDNDQEDNSKESPKANEESVPNMIVKDDIVYTNENIEKQYNNNENVSDVGSDKTGGNQNPQTNEQTSSSEKEQSSESSESEESEKPSESEKSLESEKSSESEKSLESDTNNNESMVSPTSEEKDRKEKEIYSKLLSSVLALCKNISQRMESSRPGEFAEAPDVLKLQNLISTSNATSVLNSIIEKSTRISERNESQSKMTSHKANALYSLHKEQSSSVIVSQTVNTSSQSTETISQQHQVSDNTSIVSSNSSNAEDCVITLSNGKHIKKSQLVDILQSAKNTSEIILTIPNLLSGPLDKYQHVIENFPHSFVIDNAFVHLPSDLLVPYDTYKEVLHTFAKESKTNLGKPKDVVLTSGRHLNTHVVARIIASAMCPHDRFIVLKGDTIVPYEIYKSYIDGLSQKDKESVEILIPYCPIPLSYTVYEEVVNSYLKTNTSGKADVNPLVHLWDSNEAVTLNAFMAVLNNADRQEDITVTLPNKDVVPLLVYKDILDKLSVTFKQHSNVNLPNTEEHLPYSVYKEIVDKYVHNNISNGSNATKSNCPMPLASPNVYLLTPNSKGLVPLPLPTDTPTTIPEQNGAANKTAFVCYPLHASRHVHTFPFSPVSRA